MRIKYKVKTKAVFNGQPVGSIVELDEKTAKRYEALKYLEILGEAKPAKKVSSAPKKTAKASKNAAEKQSKE